MAERPFTGGVERRPRGLDAKCSEAAMADVWQLICRLAAVESVPIHVTPAGKSVEGLK